MDVNNVSDCSRCKIKQADFICNLCEPFFHFCSNCDGYVHSLPSKRDHIRRLIKLGEKNNKSLSPVRTNNNTTSKPLAESLDSMHLKYISEIKKSHQLEIEEIAQHIQQARQAGEDRAFNLQYQLDENNKTYIMNMQLVENDYNTNLRNLLNEKDSDILRYNKLNNDIERKNIGLADQIDEYINTIRDNKTDYNLRMSVLESNLRQCEVETENAIAEYEKKFRYMIDYYNREKDHIVEQYEVLSEKMANEYNLSKENYMKLIEQREKDISILLDQDKAERLNNSKALEELSIELDKLNEENKFCKYNF